MTTTQYSNSEASAGGMGFASVLQLVFIVLKLTHLIAWSWWWVLAAAWISLGLVVVILALIVIVAVVMS